MFFVFFSKRHTLFSGIYFHIKLRYIFFKRESLFLNTLPLVVEII